LVHKLSDSGARVLVTTDLASLLPMALGLLDAGVLDLLLVGEDDAWGDGGGPRAIIPDRADVVRLPRSPAGRQGRSLPTIAQDDIALLQYTDGEKTYILAPDGLKVGMKVSSGPAAAPEVGNSLPLERIPPGSAIHNIELIPGRGGQVARSAGQQAVLNNFEAGYALVKMPSGEIRKLNGKCHATMGQVGNSEHMNVSSGKAGRSRWLGVRPTVRGMVMNPIDHPNGGGNGKSKGGGGRQHPVSPWGQLSKGFKTRKKHKPSDRFIVERRKSKKKN
jgi:ribosomal protein L2